MKKIYTLLFVLSLIAACTSCCGKKTDNARPLPSGADPRIHYVYYDVVVVQKGGCSFMDDESINSGKYFLVRSVEDTTLFTELTGENFTALSHNYPHKGDSLFYTKRLGDTLHFDYIAKGRFWHWNDYTPRYRTPNGWR